MLARAVTLHEHGSHVTPIEDVARLAHMLGRMSPGNSQVHQFSAKPLLEKPGLMHVVAAFAEYGNNQKN